MIIVPYEAKHALRIQVQMAQRDVEPFLTVERAQAMEGGFSFAAIEGEQVLAVGGVTELWEGRALVWSLLDQDACKHMVALYKAIKAIIALLPYRRLEADTPCEFSAGHKMLRMLGFKLETERMRAYRPDGGDSAMYVRLKED